MHKRKMNHCFITHFTSAPASVYSHFHRTDWRLCHLITLSTTGRPAVVEFGLRTPHLCFVCIIKETRSKLMKRYRPKLLWRKWGTMSNLRPLLVSAALAVLDVAAAYHGHLHLSIPSFETQSKFSKFWKYRCFSFSILCCVLNTPNTPNAVL